MNSRTPFAAFSAVLTTAAALSAACAAVAVLAQPSHLPPPDKPIDAATRAEVVETLDPAIELDVVAGAPREVAPGPVVSNSFAFGGHNVTLVFEP